MNELLARAAEARKAAVRSVNDRPSERRASETPGVFASRAITRHPIEFRDATSGSGLDFVGYASVTERSYEMWDFFGPYEEIVSRGAFEDTLAQASLDVPLVLNHDSLRRLARTTNGSLTLSEDDEGLRVEAPNLDPADHDVAYIAPKLRAGLIDEMSFRFSITSGQWSPDYTEFRINAADINRGDVAIVGYGASPHTSGQLRSLASKLQNGAALDERDVDLLTDALSRVSTTEAAEVREPAAAVLDGLTALTGDDLNNLFRDVQQEYQRRGVAAPMTFRELLTA